MAKKRAQTPEEALDEMFSSGGGIEPGTYHVDAASFVPDFDYGGTRDEESLAIKLEMTGDDGECEQHWGMGAKTTQQFDVSDDEYSIEPNTQGARASKGSNGMELFQSLLKCGHDPLELHPGDGVLSVESLVGLDLEFAIKMVEMRGNERPVPVVESIGGESKAGKKKSKKEEKPDEGGGGDASTIDLVQAVLEESGKPLTVSVIQKRLRKEGEDGAADDLDDEDFFKSDEADIFDVDKRGKVSLA